MYAVLWSFYGWSGGAAVSEEMKEPRRDAPRALILGTGIVALLYLAVTLAYHYVLPLDRIAGSAHVGADVAEALFGPAGSTLAAAVALIAAFGTVNGLLLSGSRIFFAMGRDGVFFRDLAWVHPRFRTPANAVVFQGLWAGFLILVPFHNLLRWLPGTRPDTSLFEGLIGFGQCAVWLFFALVSAGVVVLRMRRPDEARPFRTPGYPVVPLLFSASSLAMAVYALAHQPLQSAVGFGIMLLGLPAYRMFRRADQRAGSAIGSIEALTSETLGSWYRPVSDR
jgi:APA family basic amino acid/polyamine antiporter